MPEIKNGALDLTNANEKNLDVNVNGIASSIANDGYGENALTERLNKSITIKCKKLRDDAVIPNYATDGSIAMDLTAVECTYDSSMNCYVYHTGLAFEIPVGFGMFVAPRSSNCKTEFYVPNSLGFIDCDYRGEVKVCFKHNQGYTKDVSMPHPVLDKAMAQFVIIETPMIIIDIVDELSETERGSGGYGSTNKEVN